MGNSVKDLVTGMRIFSEPEIHHRDPFLAPCPWNNAMFENAQTQKGVKIGILQESSFLPCSAAVRRAINMTKSALTSQGYEVVDFTLDQSDFRAACDHFLGMVCNGNTPFMLEDFTDSGEALMKPLQANKTIL